MTQDRIRLCKEAAGYADGVSRGLLLSSASADLSPEERLRYATLAWSAWASLCRSMAALEPLMSRTSAEGYERQQRAAEIVEGVR